MGRFSTDRAGDADRACGAGGRRPRVDAALGRLGAIVLAVCALAVSAAIPAAGLGADAARLLADQHLGLPAELLSPPTARMTRVYANDGTTLITTFYDEDRQDVALAAVAPVMRQAIVAAEDTRFYHHGGVDLRGVLRALVSDSQGARQGGSTLTMQLVRSVLKEDPDLSAAQRRAATAGTPARKLREAAYAAQLEQHLTKAQILQDYLNVVYFGAGAYGVEAASERIFGVHAARLDLAQAALLAGVVQSPDTDNPVGGTWGRARVRQDYVLAAMVRAGMITAGQQAAAEAERLTLAGTPPPDGCVDAAGSAQAWGFFCDYVRRWWDAQPAFGATPAQRDRALRRGGYTVVTTLDPHVQHAAAMSSKSVYPVHSRRVLPIAVVQPGTGRVLALAVNRRFGTGNSVADTVNPLVTGGGSLYGYPSGSTFKLFTMLAALQDGLPLDTAYDAPARLRTRWPDYGPHACDGRYCPHNANPSWMDGHRTMWDGFGRSVNTYFVHLEEMVGPGAAVAEARKLGISFAAPQDAAMARGDTATWGAFTLGVVDTTPLELASAYATIAADGTHCSPVPVRSVTDGRGAATPIPSDCRQVLPADVARAAVDAARCPVGEQSAFHTCDGGTAEQVAQIFGGHPVAGKTGSTEDNTTESFVGFTPAVVAAGTAADPADPTDRVGSAVESQVVTAVAQTLRAAAGDGPYPAFVAPSSAIALAGSGSSAG
ncbi:transglycosylase domain-containing protein [Krasilnikovia sp. MM14-A1259]|uniref:transglycosylase domain-containing protein n=1 Tax=Krasilnikovia sp. MM14-A1259 TaxID=3373539 RepID=UPI00380B88BB